MAIKITNEAEERMNQRKIYKREVSENTKALLTLIFSASTIIFIIIITVCVMTIISQNRTQDIIQRTIETQTVYMNALVNENKNMKEEFKQMKKEFTKPKEKIQ